MSRKGLRAALAAVMMMSALVCGCAPREETGEGPSPDGLPPEREEYIVVGFSQVGSESDWRIASTRSFREAFTEENGYYLLFEDAQQKQENQLKDVRDFILQEVDYIVLDPIVETGWEGVLREARDAGIPVILADRFLEVDDEDLYTCWVGSDFREEGRMAGRWLADYLQQKGGGQEPVRIVTIQGTLGSSAQLGRTAGFADIMAEHPEWRMLDQQSGDFTQAKGKEVMEELLAQYEDIDVVVCENDNMAFGAVDAIKQAGYTCGPEGDITIISFDATPAALESMRRGELSAAVECNPDLGEKVSDLIQRLEKGESVEKTNYVKEEIYDASMDLDAAEQILGERYGEK